MRQACLVSLLIFGMTVSLPAMDEVRIEVVGCISRLPDGTLQLSASSGQSYVLKTGTSSLEQHTGQLVRITGRAESIGTAQAATVLMVDTARPVAESCTTVLPPMKREGVAGKVGAQVTATPITTTGSADETTPGFQTEAVLPAAASQYWERPNYAPAQPDQAAESATAAERLAQAATRAEILPANTLGVSHSAAAPSR